MSSPIKSLESLIFASRWIQAPLYLGLIVAQVVYCWLFMIELSHLVMSAFSSTHISEADVMLVVLGLIDVVMIANLLVMVIVGGYETFVSRLDLENHPDQPEWLSHVNAGVLKIKLSTAIIGISSIHLLKSFINAANLSEHTLMWQVIIHVVFLFSALAMALVDKTMTQTSPFNTKNTTDPEFCMTAIKQEDLIQSVADAFQYISYYHPLDYIKALGEAYDREESPAAKDAIAQILTNSRMSAEGHRPICQDTGIGMVFLKVGMQVTWPDATMSIQEMINEGVRRAYANPDNPLRASVLSDPAGTRKNTKDNTPAVVHFEIVPGHHIEVICAAKGGGSEAKAKFAMLNPSDDLVEWVLKTVPTMGGRMVSARNYRYRYWWHPEKAMLMAKESIMAPVDMHELKARGAQNRAEELRLELYEKINALGIGAQGLGGLTTVLDVKVLDFPCHAANLPVALVPNCAATRHCHFHLDGSGPAKLDPPKLEDWPAVTWTPDLKSATRVDLNTLTKEEVAAWKPGQKLLLNGKMLTGRDAAHKRIADMLAKGEKLPVDFTNRVIYYVGPVDPVRDEVVGPAGPTTGTRMDKFTRMMLEQTGLISMIGKSERGPVAIEAIKDNKSAYLMAVGGAAYLVAKAIKSAKVVGFADLGMEAIYEFDVENMPVTVAVDSSGISVHTTGPKEWQIKIGKIPVSA